jgi:LPS-assembly lipoprotein
MHLSTTSVPPHLTSLIKQQLIRSGIDLRQKAPYRLSIHQETIQKNILSISSGSSSRQYQLTYQLFFSFEQIPGPILIENQPVLVTRFLTINNDRILGSHDEEEHIIDDMRQDASQQIIQRISALPSLTKGKS